MPKKYTLNLQDTFQIFNQSNQFERILGIQQIKKEQKVGDKTKSKMSPNKKYQPLPPGKVARKRTTEVSKSSHNKTYKPLPPGKVARKRTTEVSKSLQNSVKKVAKYPVKKIPTEVSKSSYNSVERKTKEQNNDKYSLIYEYSSQKNCDTNDTKDKKIYNPLTKRCVSVSSVIGKSVITQLTEIKLKLFPNKKQLSKEEKQILFSAFDRLIHSKEKQKLKKVFSIKKK
jgi:hypothetical protein